jgi:hypothetical protein
MGEPRELDEKAFDASLTLPGGYEVQLMVLRDYPAGRPRRGAKRVFRSRIWIGLVDEPDPLVHRSQEHPELSTAVDACYSMLLHAARTCVDSPAALAAIQETVDQYFGVRVETG